MQKSSGEYADERDEQALWDVIEPAGEPASTRWFVPVVVALLIVGTPWHATLGWTLAVVAGLPVWVWISLACGTGVSVVTALAALRSWRDPELES